MRKISVRHRRTDIFLTLTPYGMRHQTANARLVRLCTLSNTLVKMPTWVSARPVGTEQFCALQDPLPHRLTHTCSLKYVQLHKISREECKDQESGQSCTTPDMEHHFYEKVAKHNKTQFTHKRAFQAGDQKANR